MKGVVLAAGRGTRMGSLTANTPKPLLPLCGVPILEHVLMGLRSAGVREVVIVVGYLGDQIVRAFGDGERLGMKIQYCRQEQADGTAGALLLARDILGDAPFWLSWGDVVIDFPEYASLAADFAAQPCDTLLSLNRCEDPWRGAAVYVDDDSRVTNLIEKPPRGTSTTPWNNAGIFVFTPVIFAYAERLRPSERGELELPQAIGAMIADGRDVRGHPLRGFWSDLGTPEDLEHAQQVFVARPQI